MALSKTQKAKTECRDLLEGAYKLKADRWGNYKIISSQNREYRIKFQSQVIRFEARAGDRWFRLSSWSYKDGVAPLLPYLKGCHQ